LSSFANFGGVATQSGGRVEHAEIVLVQAPYEGSVSYGGGTGHGPRAILQASMQVETLDDETGIDLESLSYALGPVVPGEGVTPDEYARRMEAAVRPIAAAGKIPFVLGGEHSVTIGAVRAVRETHPDAGFLSIDAHGDLREEYGGSTHSHACVCRRLLDGGPVTIVGLRSWSAEEAAFAKGAKDLRVVRAREILEGRAHLKDVVAGLQKKVYVSVDVDGFDPSVVSATGTPEPGGLLWWDVLSLLRRIAKKRTIVGMDIVELAPNGQHASDFATARLAAKMLTYVSRA
jgi:agmatinase